MKININEIKDYLDNKTSYKIFDINYTKEELDLIEKFNISNFGNYNSYNTINNLENFIKNIGKNSENNITMFYNIIKSLLENILKAYDTDSYWISLRILSKTDFFDIPRYHCDGYYFRDRNKLQTKFITTLRGPTTLILDVKEEYEKDILQMNSLNTFTDLEKREHIAKYISGEKINITNTNGIIFVAGNKEKCLVHSEPKHDDNRIFISILPGTREEINDFSERSERMSKNYLKLDKFYKAFSYPFLFISENDEYKIENILIMMFDKNLKKEKINLKYFDFPSNIEDVYWFEEGINDEKPWMFVGKVRYKDKYKYIYYVAEADYTGFDCQGYMKLYVSKSLNRLIKNAIPSDVIKNNEDLKNILNKFNA